ncbi:translation initiation factor 2 [uncultured Acetatifactor sp.]|uniref:translation initiation factor 2 n=1 Tax=uncultured Acetatifactor sp. TaxID=1671927 RepID=UPI0026126408|nr:translation initiation factor 2 [uncultured Acetatifactor sp.]
MKGKYHIVVQNNRLRYELDIRRNITIIRGDSATGKTKLIDLLEQAADLGEGSGVEVLCERPCRTLGGKDWNLVLPNIHQQILFLDEENKFVKSREFASAVKASDNYFVIVTREDLPNLPYSVEEIYGIHASGKYHDLKRTYNELYHIYSTEAFSGGVSPETVIVEDSNSGYEFFRAICSENGMDCLSAGGKSNLKTAASRLGKEPAIVIADGAAIGPEMNELYQMMRHKPEVKCYLPESFEWLILKSGMIDGKLIQDILEHPEDFIESREYLSWERFFTALLAEHTRDSRLRYSKNQLNPAYLHEKTKQALLTAAEGVDWKKSMENRNHGGR